MHRAILNHFRIGGPRRTPSALRGATKRNYRRLQKVGILIVRLVDHKVWTLVDESERIVETAGSGFVQLMSASNLATRSGSVGIVRIWSK